MTDRNKPYFVTSKNFRGDNEYVEWLREIKSRYHTDHNHVVITGSISSILYDGDKPPH